MREILFRGQTRKFGQKVNMDGEKQPGIWVYGGIFPGTGDYSVIYGGSVEKLTGADIEKHVVYSDTVGQFTGLTDKNGKKIFEGDIVKHYCEHRADGIISIGVVFWDEKRCMFLRTSTAGNETPQIWAGCEYEVIGNIHDNPDLLEG